MTEKVPVSKLFLDADERYDVFNVKLAERPHLVHETRGEDDDEDNTPPALSDGCDIAGWRLQDLVVSGAEMTAISQVGASCPLLRRTSQLLPIQPDQHWKKQLPRNLWKDTLDVPRGDCCEVSQMVNNNHHTRFAIEYEQTNVPVIIDNATTSWQARSWSFASFLERFRHVYWRFSDTHGEMMTMETYFKYIKEQGLIDDSPLAIYDSEFGDEDSPTHGLVDEYTVPPCFSKDLFDYCSSNERPPWRWILMGPARSGTGMHIDPLYTNAWVTLLEGCKRWMLFPPETPPDEIGMQTPQIASVVWFKRYYSKVTDAEFKWKPVEILQLPGETVFVPCGWPHVVLNLESSLAVTHNYASEFHFDKIYKVCQEEEPEFCKDWLEGLQQHRPDILK